MSNIFKYSEKEEKWNVYTHLAGIILAVAGLVFLLINAVQNKTVWHIVSYSIYGVSMIVLYTASTVFHSSKNPNLRPKLNIFDHASIYFLIAGTYTPFTLVTLRGSWGWSIFGIIWGLAIAGIILKLFYIGKYKKLSTLFYVLMGWLIIIAIKPLYNSIDFAGLMWLITGGVLYSIGAVFYLLRKLKYNHAIFHFFVLGGTIAHYFAIYFYV